MSNIGFLAADWPAPAGINAGTTLRWGGVSRSPFDSLNLGAATGDAPAAVRANRARLAAALDLPGEPAWLEQNHGVAVADAGGGDRRVADASIGSEDHAVCVVLTADCLPVLFCDREARCWAAAHAGWRGLAAGVLEATVARLPVPAGELMTWLGPAIGADRFEVGEDVREAFCDRHPKDASAFAARPRPGKYLADIYALARARLQRVGLTHIHGGGLCTIDDAERFYSYRRSARTGRMASLVWRAP